MEIKATVEKNEIIQYLETIIKIMEWHNHTQFNNYTSLQDFVLKNGEPWVGQAKPKQYRWGQQKNCYKNATDLVLGNNNLTYVEGYASAGLIPVPHAWCVDTKNQVIDNTWRPRKSLKETSWNYFGIKIDTKFLAKTIVKQKFYGILETPATVIQMMKNKKQTWKA